MPSQITYRYLFPGTEPTYDELSSAELVGVRQVGAKKVRRRMRWER